MGILIRTELLLNYDSKSISIEDENGLSLEILVKKQSVGGKTIFKNGAYLYIGLLETLLINTYPYKRGSTFVIDSFPSTERISKFVSDLNCVLPGFLKITGTSSLTLNHEIEKRLISVSVTASKLSSIDNRSRFGDLLSSFNWEQKNKEIEAFYSGTSPKKAEPMVETDMTWDTETLKVISSDYNREGFDKKLLMPISPYGIDLYNYVQRTLTSQTEKRICVLEGTGGIGKTTSIKYTASKLSEKGHIAVIIYANQLQKKEQSVCSYISERFILFQKTKRKGREPVIDIVSLASHEHKVYIFIDGVDELPSKYYKDLIGDDINALCECVTDNLFFVVSTRQRNAFIEQCDIEKRSIVAFSGYIDLNTIELGKQYKELLVNYPQFRTPLFISMIRSLMDMVVLDESGNLFDYGYSETKRIINKTQLFDAWMELRTSHAEKMGIKPYYYTHLLTLTAYDSLKKYIRNGDRNIDRGYFETDRLSRRLERFGGKIRSSIDIGFDTDKLIKMFLGTGLLKTSDNEHYMFSNMEYMLYLAGFFVSLLFVHETKHSRLARIAFLTQVSVEKTNPNLALVSYPEFAFNRIMDSVRNNKCKIDNDEKLALLKLGLAIGYEKVRDVDENLRILMSWFKDTCKRDLESVSIAWRFNSPLYNMITKWKTNPKSAEQLLQHISSYYDWLSEYLGSDKQLYIDQQALPIDYEATVFGNRGAVEQEFAKYIHQETKEDRSIAREKQRLHLINALNYHKKAYLYRTELLKNKKNKTSIVLTGLARNIISLSTDLFYLSSYIDDVDLASRAELLLIGLYGGKGPKGLEIPGYVKALNLQGKFVCDDFSWTRNMELDLRECEPCVIFRRMSGNCYSLYKLVGCKYIEIDVISSLFKFIMLASYDLYTSCVDGEKYSESRLEFFRPEINSFVLDINDKFLKVIKEQEKIYDVEAVSDKIELVLEIYNALHHTAVKLDRVRYKLRNY